ncbi:4-(cytidine 5'-diphospho)-2-C-methyl-D-erythritol kinase [Siculibacillus lacustris]|uniref:4-diphosphocytidyl-2-C-methyl-D-erythritol kinase n=1 Tax=Siculibacillus lacustris TaxID=1549641 RepID=A0A4Q9VJ81_9HYPH|nr:4-(cytidine 5'-diphospho)-2-C-methyl-D-erythritol kinase [Siculibacillus lacustris]TBW34432.1 4-(cytidine 5'-diphospho)-2-C-methyl-D-erythritol kinase [Siculibacillus lacustris]
MSAGRGDAAGGWVCEDAPAKINLALAVTGRRADGYHFIDTLVAHGVAGDTVAARVDGVADAAADPIRGFEVDGRFAAGLDGEADNLVLRAARLLAREAARRGRPTAAVTLRLTKRLPIASGLGGGSSDAAATLRLLDRIWDLGLGRMRLAELAAPLGADLPMCVLGTALRARGIGEATEPVAGLPILSLVLVNPGVAVATPAVFKALTRRDHPPLPQWPAAWDGVDGVARWLSTTRNDLEAAAIGLAPPIGDGLAALAARPGCLLARMSGSGATCFGLFADPQAAAQAAVAIAAARPSWWAVAGTTLGDPSVAGRADAELP